MFSGQWLVTSHQSLVADFADLDLICITPDPGFARLNGPHQGMFGVMKVFSGVFVFRGIAAGHVAADQAHAQVDPAIAHLYTLVTYPLVGFAEFDLVGMSASLCHEFSFILTAR